MKRLGLSQAPFDRLIIAASLILSAAGGIVPAAVPQPDEWKGHAAGVTGAAFIPGGDTVISCSLDGTVRSWDSRAGVPIRTLTSGNGEIQALSVDAAGLTAAISRYDGMITIVSLKNGSERSFSGYRGWSADIALSPDAKRVAVWAMDGEIWIFDTASGKRSITLKGQPNKWGMALAWSPDGKLLAAGRVAIALWDINSGQVVRTLEGHSHFVRDLDFSSDGRCLASAAMDKSIRVWDIIDGKEKLILKPEGFAYRSDSGLVLAPISLPATAVAFSPDGKTLGTGGADRIVRLWDASAGTLMKEFKGHFGAVTALAFSPDGSRIVSAGLDHIIRSWRLD